MKAVLLIIIIVASSHAAWGAPPPDVTAEQAVALYRAHSPRLAAERSQEQVTRADVVDARIYPNPSVGLASAGTVRGTDTIGVTQSVLTLDIPILIGHQRARRETAALRHVDATHAEVAATQGDAELGIRARVATLLAAQEQTAVLTAALADARAVRDIVAGRAGAGADSSYAVERIDLAIAVLASRVDDAAAAEASASGDLAGAVGIADWHPHAIGELISADTELPQQVAAMHPSLAIERAGEAAAQADEARARADAIPTPTLGLQSFGTSDPFGVVVGAGVTIALPFFDRNQGAVARARAEANRATLELLAKTTELAADLDRARRVLAARRDALAHFQTDALQRLGKLRTMAETAYRSGQGGIVELLDALDAITDARLREIELRAAVADAQLSIRRAALGR